MKSKRDFRQWAMWNADFTGVVTVYHPTQEQKYGATLEVTVHSKSNPDVSWIFQYDKQKGKYKLVSTVEPPPIE
jgi:hypothetical protein